MKSFEQKAIESFNDIIIHKGLIHNAGFGSRAIPKYVGEWIIANYNDAESTLSEVGKEKIAKFINKYVPQKGDKELLKNKLFEQDEVQLLDNFSVYVNLDKGDRYLNVPYFDETGAFVAPQVVQDNQMLFSSGLWGVGTLFYIPPSDDSPRGQMWMKEFKPFQIANIDMDYFLEARASFSTEEWIDLIISSMGFNHEIYTLREKLLLICRLVPMVEPRFTLIELAPKGTGKSFVFDNMSRYVSVRSGTISAPVLFYNDARKTPGLITRFDCVVLDECQKVQTDSKGELTALLKSYLESGKFARGASGSISAEAGLVLLANIEIDENRQPVNNNIGLFRIFPNFLTETAFVDRFSGLLPGWELPRISKDSPSKHLGFKGDIFGEILHILRSDISFKDYVKSNTILYNCDDMRDSKAIEAGATGLLKIIFPHKNPSEQEFYTYCVNPALELRQRVRDELCKMDKEYPSVTFKSQYPDAFQVNHKKVIYYDPTDAESLLASTVDTPKNTVQPQLDEPKIILKEKTIKIKDGESGWSYSSLFQEYLADCKKIILVDPYIRLDHQIKNLISFIDLILPKDGNVELQFTTSYEDEYGKSEQDRKFKELQTELLRYGVIFDYSFDPKIHYRLIETDSGWQIKSDRGLDIFHKPETKLGLGDLDQKKRKCRETVIDYIKVKA